MTTDSFPHPTAEEMRAAMARARQERARAFHAGWTSLTTWLTGHDRTPSARHERHA